MASGGAAGRYHERPRSRRAENQADSTIEEAVRLRTRCTLQQLGPSLPLCVRSILPLALPYPCDPKNGSAAFDSSTSGEFTLPPPGRNAAPLTSSADGSAQRHTAHRTMMTDRYPVACCWVAARRQRGVGSFLFVAIM